MTIALGTRLFRAAAIGTLAGALVAAPTVPLLTSPASGAAAVPLSPCYPSDNGNPVVTAFSISPAVLDLREGPVRVTVTAQVTDKGGPGEASGMATVRLAIGRGRWLAEGSAGTWQSTFLVRPGEWRSGSVQAALLLADKAGNTVHLGYRDLAALGGNASVEVRSPRDQTAPRLVDLRLSRSAVDSRTRPQEVRVRARLTDNLSGTRSVRVFATGARVMPARLHLSKGSTRDGWWSGKLPSAHLGGHGERGAGGYRRGHGQQRHDLPREATARRFPAVAACRHQQDRHHKPQYHAPPASIRPSSMSGPMTRRSS